MIDNFYRIRAMVDSDAVELVCAGKNVEAAMVAFDTEVTAKHNVQPGHFGIDVAMVHHVTFESDGPVYADVTMLLSEQWARCSFEQCMQFIEKGRKAQSMGAIAEVMMSDLVGDYDRPETVPEWAWIEGNASYAHRKNGSEGIWEFLLNLSLPLSDAPKVIAAEIARQRSLGASYLLIHQGT